LPNFCREKQGSVRNTRLLVGRPVTYGGENMLLATLRTHNLMDLLSTTYARNPYTLQRTLEELHIKKKNLVIY
jgi:hypothetical protein